MVFYEKHSSILELTLSPGSFRPNKCFYVVPSILVISEYHYFFTGFDIFHLQHLFAFFCKKGRNTASHFFVEVFIYFWRFLRERTLTKKAYSYFLQKMAEFCSTACVDVEPGFSQFKNIPSDNLTKVIVTHSFFNRCGAE